MGLGVRLLTAPSRAAAVPTATPSDSVKVASKVVFVLSDSSFLYACADGLVQMCDMKFSDLIIKT